LLVVVVVVVVVVGVVIVVVIVVAGGGNLYAGEDLADVAAKIAVVEHGDVEAVWPKLGEEVCQRAGLEPDALMVLPFLC